MNVSVVMPQLGLTMEEGTVSGWLKKPGEKIKRDEPLFTVTTDKVEMEVESMVEGTLREIVVPEGETVKVATVVAYVEVAGSGDVSSAQEPTSAAKASAAISEIPLPTPDKQQGTVVQLENRSAGSRHVSPRAKRLAKELGVDLASLQASGADGQIVEADVKRASKPTGVTGSPDRRRQLIAEKLTLSIQTIPTFSVAIEVNCESLLSRYQELGKTVGTGLKLTVTDLLLALTARALKASPEINSVWRDNAVQNRTTVDIGLAVATQKGVVAPVIRNLDALDIRSLVSRRTELVAKAREGHLALSDLEGAIGTLSNLGMKRVDHFEAIIAPGQTFILAVGQIKDRPWVDGKALVVKPTVILNLTVDHRVVDGFEAATFLGKIAELIESPDKLS